MSQVGVGPHLAALRLSTRETNPPFRHGLLRPTNRRRNLKRMGLLIMMNEKLSVLNFEVADGSGHVLVAD